jgi:hypothetical protein
MPGAGCAGTRFMDRFRTAGVDYGAISTAR